MRQKEKDYIERVDYLINVQSTKTINVFSALNKILFNSFKKDNNFHELRCNLEKIINGDTTGFSVENVAAINVMYKSNGINKSKLGISIYDNEKIGNINNDLVKVLQDVFFAKDNEPYSNLINYYLIYFYLKCKNCVENIDFLEDKINNLFQNEFSNTNKLNSLLNDDKKLVSLATKVGGLTSFFELISVLHEKNNINSKTYINKVNEKANICMSKEGFSNSPLKYVDSSSILVAAIGDDVFKK